jgi:hypothetical protein
MYHYETKVWMFFIGASETYYNYLLCQKKSQDISVFLLQKSR